MTFASLVSDQACDAKFEPRTMPAGKGRKEEKKAKNFAERRATLTERKVARRSEWKAWKEKAMVLAHFMHHTKPEHGSERPI